MGELKLSAKAFHSLMDQVVAAGILKQSEVDHRNSLSPGTVVVGTRPSPSFRRLTKKSRLSAQLMLPSA